ncbi:MAG TPA: hypothetical protein VG826_11380 [Pirellulales bacterium]|nr:hypothetical protein [Pirellulales bacterium]
MCRPTRLRKRDRCQHSEPAWRELYAALRAGVPRAADIATALDAHRLTYPSAPLFDDADADVGCYGVIHRAWRERLLHEFLELLCLWRQTGGSLCETARHKEFQTALFEFLAEHRKAGLPALLACFKGSNVLSTLCENEAVCVADWRGRFDAVWHEQHARCAA